MHRSDSLLRSRRGQILSVPWIPASTCQKRNWSRYRRYRRCTLSRFDYFSSTSVFSYRNYFLDSRHFRSFRKFSTLLLSFFQRIPAKIPNPPSHSTRLPQSIHCHFISPPSHHPALPVPKVVLPSSRFNIILLEQVFKHLAGKTSREHLGG